MSLDISPLLIHSDDVPQAAKVALMAARTASPEDRETLLEAAARALYWKTPLACGEARELVGLTPGTCG
ncbi:MAG: hypothetical protein IPJ65_29300 [Archangiaceae bacterium]|nr:hypothetical protein [Archangiaceae bacterium]